MTDQEQNNIWMQKEAEEYERQKARQMGMGNALGSGGYAGMGGGNALSQLQNQIQNQYGQTVAASNFNSTNFNSRMRRYEEIYHQAFYPTFILKSSYQLPRSNWVHQVRVFRPGTEASFEQDRFYSYVNVGDIEPAGLRAFALGIEQFYPMGPSAPKVAKDYMAGENGVEVHSYTTDGNEFVVAMILSGAPWKDLIHSKESSENT